MFFSSYRPVGTILFKSYHQTYYIMRLFTPRIRTYLRVISTPHHNKNPNIMVSTNTAPIKRSMEHRHDTAVSQPKPRINKTNYISTNQHRQLLNNLAISTKLIVTLLVTWVGRRFSRIDMIINNTSWIEIWDAYSLSPRRLESDRFWSEQ